MMNTTTSETSTQNPLIAYGVFTTAPLAAQQQEIAAVGEVSLR